MQRILVALDLDGTLLCENSELPAGHEDAVRCLFRLGVQVAIVTGRPLLTSEWVWKHLGLQTPLVCFNGAWVGIPGQPPLALAQLDEKSVRFVISALGSIQDLDGALCAYPSALTWVMDREIPHTRRWREYYQTNITVDSQRFANWHGPSLKLMFVTDPESMTRAAPLLRAALGNSYHVVLSQDDRIEILPRGVDKAWGLAHLARHLGVEQAQVWAVGDADNDFEMIGWAGHGCAMGHAPERLRGVARHILPSIHARGLCALEPLIEREYLHRLANANANANAKAQSA